MGFYIYQVVILLNTLEVLKILEEMLNKNNKTLQPIQKIMAMHDRLEKSIEDYNLRNEYALARRKNYYLTTSEWNILQASLCCSIGFHENYGKDLFSDDMFSEIKKLHKRFECNLNRIIGGLKSRGYKINMEKLEEYKSRIIDHDPSKAIQKLSVVK